MAPRAASRRMACAAALTLVGQQLCSAHRHGFDPQSGMLATDSPSSAATQVGDELSSGTSAAALEAAAARSGAPYWIDQLRVKNYGYQAAYCGWSKDNCATLEDFPGNDVHSELTWAAVVRELPQVPEQQKKGEIYRAPELGYAVANGKLWERDVGRLSLGFPVPQHEFVRPIMDRIVGAEGEGKTWTKKYVEDETKKFLDGHAVFENEKDVHMFASKILHKVHLNMELSDIEAEDFYDFQQEAKVKVILPTALNVFMGWPKLQDTRDEWIAKYDKAVRQDNRGVFPSDMTAEQRSWLLSTLLDSLMFAGGLSVPGYIMTGLGVAAAADSPWLQRENDMKVEKAVDLAVKYSYEVIRRYPPVVGFPWYTPDGKHRTVMNLAMTLRDPRVWGVDSLDFRLRDVPTYRNLTRTAWAEPANGPEAWAVQNPGRTGHLTPMSRGCPGQALSFTIISTFFEEWFKVRSNFAVATAPKGGITFHDMVPFVPVITLAKIVKKGPAMLETSALRGLWGYKFAERHAVLLAGDAERPAQLLLFKDAQYAADDPGLAQSVPLTKGLQTKVKAGKKYGFQATRECLKLYSTKWVRLCFDGTGHESPAAARDKWLEAVGEHTAE